MKKKILIALLVLVLASLIPSVVLADSTTPVNTWFCSIAAGKPYWNSHIIMPEPTPAGSFSITTSGTTPDMLSYIYLHTRPFTLRSGAIRWVRNSDLVCIY